MRRPATFARWALLLAGAACALGALAGPAAAAEPPSLVNYEGILRDPNGVPRNGDFDMIFSFFDGPTAGNEILLDAHVASGTGQVKVVGGLFNVLLGSGEVVDGSAVLPNDPYGSLAEVLRDFTDVWMEVQVGGETLAPRIRMVAAPYALNADHLDGRDASGFLDTSAASQAKSGQLTVGSLQVGGPASVAGQVTIQGGSPAAGRVLTSGPTGLASWQELPAVQADTLRDLADRLSTSNPSQLPFAALRSFDCSGVKTASLLLTIGASSPGTVTGFVGGGGISEIYQYLVAVERSDATLNTAGLIGQTGRIILQRDGATTFFSGMVTEAGLAGWDGSTATYVFRLEPHLSLLSRSSGYDAFAQQPASDIIQALLGAAGLSAAVLEATSYQYEVAMRYQETPLAFLNRLAEGEGVHYHFREGASADEVLFLTSNAAFTAIPGSFSYYGDLQDPGTGEEFVATFHARERQYSGDGRVVGWNDVTKQAVVASILQGGSGELQEFDADVDDSSLALARAEALVAREQVRRQEHSGTGSVAYLKAGHTFTLNDLTTAGLDGSYLVTEIRHYAVNEPGISCVSYGNAFTAVPSTVDYQPPLRALPPRAQGPVRALVTNIEDPDRLGRIKVRIHPDSSTGVETGWIRIAVPSWRQDTRVFLPDVNDEVLVEFVRGDPRVPVVIGSLYNGVDRAGAPPVLGGSPGNEIFMVNLGTGPLSRTCYDDLDPNAPSACDQAINFWDDFDPRGERFSWQDAADRFELTNDLGLEGSLSLGGGSIIMKESLPEASQFLYFFDAGSPTGEALAWNDPADTFELSNDLKLSGALEASGQLKGASLDVGTGTITGGTLLNMNGGQIQGGSLLLGSGPILAGSLIASGTVQGATVNATGTLNGGADLVLPGPITLNGAGISHSTGTFSLAGGLSVGGDAGLTGDLNVGGGDITATTLNITPSSTLVLSGSVVSLNATNAIVASDSFISSMIDDDNNSAAMNASWFHDGSFTNVSKLADLDESGNFRVRGSLTPFVSFDLAESFLAADPVEPGDLVRLDPDFPGAVRLTEGAGDPLAIGVVSGRPGIVLGGGAFDVEALRSAWGEGVGNLFEAERPRLREEVLRGDPDLREVIEPANSGTGQAVLTPGRGPSEEEPSGASPDAGASGRVLSVEDLRRDPSGAPTGAGGTTASHRGAHSSEEAIRQAEERVEALSLERFYQERFAPVALAGRVPVKADASRGAIEPGDGLAPGPEPGVAVRAGVDDPVVATALEGLAAGRGLVLALVGRERSGSGRTLFTASAEGSGEGISVAAADQRGAGAALATGRAAPGELPSAGPGALETGRPFSVHGPGGDAADDGPEILRVDAGGNVYARGAFLPASMDLAEYFPLSEPAGPGDLLAVDRDRPGRYGLARQAGDPAVVGVVSAEPGVLLGAGIDRIAGSDAQLAAELEEARALGDEARENAIWSRLRARFEETHAPVALAGTVLCKVDAAYGAIAAGDLLVASSTPGHAQRADDPAPGTVVGKALEALDNGTGRIRILVMAR